MPHLIFLLHYHRIGQPFWIPDLDDEACIEQSVDFFIHIFRPLRSELLFFLPNRFERRVSVQLVGRYNGVYPLHIRSFPCESRSVCFEEGSNAYDFRRVGFINVDFPDFFLLGIDFMNWFGD